MSPARRHSELVADRSRELDLAAFRAIAEFTYDWESWVDIRGILVWINAAVERITGYSPEECLAMPEYPLPLIHEEDRPRIRSLGEAARAGDSGNHIEFRIQAKDGTTRWAAISYQPIIDEKGARAGYRSSVRDIEERKQMEARLRDALAEAEEANLAKTRFLAGVSHELRTPLQSILSHAELLARADLPHDLKRYAEDMTREGEHLARLVGDLLDFSALEAGGLTIAKRVFSPRLEFTARLESLARAAARKDLEFRFDLGDGELYAESDPDRCLQVLTNLVSNAIQYTNEGQIAVRAQFENGHLTMAVEDGGPGLPSGVELFEPFRRGANATSPSGFGLGLAISARLCQRLGGTLVAESHPGAGTRMIARVPVRMVGRQELPSPRNRSSKALVLLIDDTGSSRAALSDAVKALGHNVRSAASLNEAWGVLEGKMPDLILLDLNMPGPAVTEKSRVLRDRLGRAPRLHVMSAGGIFTDPAALTNAGIDGFVQKPISLELLTRLVGTTSAAGEPHEARMVEQETWDAKRLGELRGHRGPDGRSLGERIARRLDDDVRALAERVQSAVTRNSAAALSEPIHDILGLAALLGAIGAQEELKVLEEQARADQPVAVDRLLDLLRDLYAGFTEHFPLENSVTQPARRSLRS